MKIVRAHLNLRSSSVELDRKSSVCLALKSEQVMSYRLVDTSLTTIYNEKRGDCTTGVYEPIFAKSQSMNRAMEIVSQVAPLHAAVLIFGNRGTGKRFLAQKIHQMTETGRGPFVNVDCRGIEERVLRLRLLGGFKKTRTGYDKFYLGALTAANGGSLLLKNVDYLSLPLQHIILKAIQDKYYIPIGATRKYPFNARVMATMNSDPEHQFKMNRFRTDFYYRITVYPIRMASLEERKQDLKQMALFFLNRAMKRRGLGTVDLSEHVLFMLAAYNWPGNVTELYTVMEKVAGKLEPTDNIVLLKHLPSKISLLHERKGLELMSSISILPGYDKKYLHRDFNQKAETNKFCLKSVLKQVSRKLYKLVFNLRSLIIHSQIRSQSKISGLEDLHRRGLNATTI